MQANIRPPLYAAGHVARRFSRATEMERQSGVHTHTQARTPTEGERSTTRESAYPSRSYTPSRRWRATHQPLCLLPWRLRKEPPSVHPPTSTLLEDGQQRINSVCCRGANGRDQAHFRTPLAGGSHTSKLGGRLSYPGEHPLPTVARGGGVQAQDHRVQEDDDVHGHGEGAEFVVHRPAEPVEGRAPREGRPRGRGRLLLVVRRDLPAPDRGRPLDGLAASKRRKGGRGGGGGEVGGGLAGESEGVG